MAVNVFEGSRRIALILKILWVATVALFTWTTSPYVSLNFVTNFPNDGFERTDEGPSYGNDRIRSISRDIGDGRTVMVNLYFKARRATSGDLVVPYKVDADGTWWGNRGYSDDVEVYTQSRAETFTLGEVDLQAAREEWDRQRWTNLRNGALFAIGGWIALSLLQAMVGWIVRGFMGIPRGQDRRPEPASSVKSGAVGP